MTAVDPDHRPAEGESAAPASGPERRAAAAADLAADVAEEIGRAVVGKRDVVDLVLAAVLARGHVLLEDVPGVAKTLLARSLATACGLGFRRVQFTPDLLPADITGSVVLDLASRTPTFRPGPVFTEILLADEINRAPAKTQAALLEAMQEGQVTIDGDPHDLGRPFAVVATQNPIEAEGTYPLPEAQLDRFLVRVGIGYPDLDDERAIVAARLARTTADVTIEPVVSRQTFVSMQAAVEDVHVDDSLVDYALALVRATRDEPDIAIGASPRGSLALVGLARAWALVRGRDYVGPDDLRALAVPVLAHRITLDDDAWVRGTHADDVVRRVIDRVPAPSWS